MPRLLSSGWGSFFFTGIFLQEFGGSSTNYEIMRTQTLFVLLLVASVCFSQGPTAPPYGTTIVTEGNGRATLKIIGFEDFQADPKVISGTSVEFDVSLSSEILPLEPTESGPGFVHSYVKALTLTIGGHLVALKPPPELPVTTQLPHPLQAENRRIRFSSVKLAEGIRKITASGTVVFETQLGDRVEKPISSSVDVRVYNRSISWMTTLVRRNVPEDENIGNEWPDAAAAGVADARTKLESNNISSVEQNSKLKRVDLSGRDSEPFEVDPPPNPPFITQATILFAFTHGHSQTIEDSGIELNTQNDFVGKLLHYINHIGYAVSLKGNPNYKVPGSNQPLPPLTLVFHYACDTAGSNRNNWTIHYQMDGVTNRAWVGFKEPVWSTHFAGNNEPVVTIPKNSLLSDGPKDLLSLHSERLLGLLCQQQYGAPGRTLEKALAITNLEYLPRTMTFNDEGFQFKKLELWIPDNSTNHVRLDKEATLAHVYQKNFSVHDTQDWWYLTKSF